MSNINNNISSQTQADVSFGDNASLSKVNSSVEQKPAFWVHTETIDASRWSQAFPYQLLLVSKNSDNTYSSVLDWVFTLPITPESLSIDMPFAISLGATQGGVVSEHNGAPFRIINLSGSFGILPLRGHADVFATPSLDQAIFAGTIQNFTRTANSIQQIGTINTGPSTPSNLIDPNSITNKTILGQTTGYYQFRLLQRFLENYVEFKKTDKGRDFRLAFAVWKQEAVYLCEPTGYSTKQSANSPLEYLYSLSLKAYRRVTLDSSSLANNVFRPAVRDSNQLAKVLNTLTQSRVALSTLKDLISSIVGDVDRVLFEPIRQASGFMKDLLAVSFTAAEMPNRLIQSTKNSVIQAISVKNVTTGYLQKISDVILKTDIQDILQVSNNTNQAQTGQFTQNLFALPTNPVNKIFNNPEQHFALFNSLNIGDLSLQPTIIDALNQDRNMIRNLSRLDFENYRDQIVQLLKTFEDSVGVGGVISMNTPTDTDFSFIYALNDVIIQLNYLAASGDTNQFAINNINYVAGLASQSGIAFQIPKSKFSIPFPYGASLEDLANQYLKNPDRWIEIATLNGLRDPYIDEEGFSLPLLVNGNGNIVIVDISSPTNLFMGQLVSINGVNVTITSRHILDIKTLPDNTTLLTLDGPPDLSKFTTIAKSYLHAFLPDTVNSQMTIFIPSDEDPIEEDFRTKLIPGVDLFDKYLNVGGVDLLLTQDGDLAITNNGDVRLAVGLNNIIQNVRIRLSVPQGKLNRHPGFGLAIEPGTSTADLDSATLLKAAKNLFNDDDSFNGVGSAIVNKFGSTVSLGIQIGIKGISNKIPVSINLNKT